MADLHRPAAHHDDADAVTDPGLAFDDHALHDAFFAHPTSHPDLHFPLSDSTDALAGFAPPDDFALLPAAVSQLLPDLPPQPPLADGEHSMFSVMSPDEALSESRASRVARKAKPDALKLSPAIRKTARASPTILDSPVTHLHTPRAFSAHSDSDATPPSAPRSRDAEARRLQHNEMMRANRERANNKFRDLEQLLRDCAPPSLRSRPMRNKMQVLDRAMTQYPAMRAQRAARRAALLLGAERDTAACSMLADVRSPVAAAHTLARLLLGAQRWSAAEIWASPPARQLSLVSALAASHNAPPAARALHAFSARTAHQPDALVERAARLYTSVWVPDLCSRARRYRRANDAARAAISTALYVPIAHAADGKAAVVLVLYHADDDSCSNGTVPRVFDADQLARVDELAAAVGHSRRMGG